MADDPELETQINTITERIKEVLKELDELDAPSNRDKENQLQKKISTLHEKRDKWIKALTGQSPKEQA